MIIDIGDENVMCVNRFVIDGLNYLNSIKIGSNSFTKNKNMYEMISLDHLPYWIEIGSYSVSDYSGTFELKNLTKLSRIKMGETRSGSYNFFYSSFEIEGINMMILNE